MQLSAIRLPVGVRRLPGLRALPLPAIAPLRSGMARWIDARSPRERWLIAALAVVAAATLLVALVWRPIEAAHSAALADIDRYDRIAARLRVAGPDVARMAAARAVTPSTTITDSAAKAGLTIQRIEPQGVNIGVTLDAAGFDALVGWLAALERDAGMRVVELKLERRPDPGVVSAQVTLATT